MRSGQALQTVGNDSHPLRYPLHSANASMLIVRKC